MSRKHIDANTPCCEPGCLVPRHIAKTGKVMTRCKAHYTAWNEARTNKHRAKYGKPALGKGYSGAPQPPTVLIDTEARTVRQIVGNTVVSACELPERGLHAVTLDILRKRGWRVRYVGAVRERESA